MLSTKFTGPALLGSGIATVVMAATGVLNIGGFGFFVFLSILHIIALLTAKVSSTPVSSAVEYKKVE